MTYKNKQTNQPVYIGKDFWDSGVDPPSSTELEKIVLGSILIEYNTLQKLGSDFNVNLFFDQKNRKIAEAISDLWQKKALIDIVTLVDFFTTTKKWDKDLGLNPLYIAKLTERIATTAHLEYHIRLLQEMYLKRYITETCAKTMSQIHTGKSDVFELHSDLMKKLDRALVDVVQIEAQSLSSLNEELNLEQIIASKSEGLSGVPTGMKRIDKVTSGWQNSDLIIIAGRPSMGKTAFILSAILSPAIDDKIPIAIFSLEMSKKQLTARLQAQLSGIDVGRIVRKQLTPDEAYFNQAASQLLNDAPIYIDDTAGITDLQLQSKARKLVRECGVKLIIVDYLQLMRSAHRTSSREQEIAEISRSLKQIAKELDIPVIALAQLSRSVETRGGDKIPMLSDLRESGQIEQDADMVAFCYRPEYYGIMEYEIDHNNYTADGLFMLIIAKHRNGSLGEIPLSFIKKLARIQTHELDDPNLSYIFVQRGFAHQKEVQEGFKPLLPNNAFESERETSHLPQQDEWLMSADDNEVPF